MKKLTRVATGAAAVALTSIVMVAPPASADIVQCPNSGQRACAWYNANYTGSFGAWSTSQTFLGGFNDAISSFGNRGTTQIGWFFDAGYGGERFLQNPPDYGHFSAFDYRNDKFSSLFIYSF